ncbi:hypothetical protein Clacol_006055 [Clathrus columnatus]|uniref:Uncharacterized protein n=1 Tax=Clathrus columnatus TaxID=1419009 RepID=A0AAV5ADW1_9AGAM|nr:hypothetical protein Clacol_006055 [Clathrus columnatus]
MVLPNQRDSELSQNFSESESESEIESVPDPNDDDPFIVGKGKGKSTRGTNTNVHTTPSTRIPKKDQRSMSGAAKKRVNKATAGEKLAGSRCVVENTSEDNAVEYAHCFPRGAHDDIAGYPSLII